MSLPFYIRFIRSGLLVCTLMYVLYHNQVKHIQKQEVLFQKTHHPNINISCCIEFCGSILYHDIPLIAILQSQELSHRQYIRSISHFCVVHLTHHPDYKKEYIFCNKINIKHCFQTYTEVY